ncbi:MAG: aspartate/glutamate racemase family protein [Acidobacteriota bacterium]|jgi:glutamate racemase
MARDKNLCLVVTDSGLGGLSICAEIERILRQTTLYRNVRITYFNAWPDPRSGYNDLPDMQSRAGVFNGALIRMAQFEPDRIVIACNTLSILYPMTEFSRTTRIPVLGIIDAGVDLFCEALNADPLSAIVLFGTRTTIQSRVHRDRLVQKGIQGSRIMAISCHGLAAAIEKNPESRAVTDLIEECVSEACKAGLPGERLYVGLCCTHFTYVKESIRASLARRSGKSIHILDPNHRVAGCVAPGEAEALIAPARAKMRVEVISKVALDDNQRRALAKQVEPVSAVTARALLSYTHQPDLF